MCKEEEQKKDRRLAGKFKQFFATICLGPISMGCSLAWTSPVLPQLLNLNSTTSFHITVEEGSWVGSMLAIGALTSAIPAGFLADRFGLKKCTIGFAIPVAIFTVLAVCADNVYTLCAARLFSGIATGGVSVVAPMYISEIADVSLRGTLGSFFELLIYLGVVVTAVFGAFVDYVTFTLIMGVVAILLATIFLFFPESPTYLIKVNKRKKAEKALRFYRSEDFDVGCVLDDIEDSLSKRPQEKKSHVGDILKSRAAIRGLVACVGLTSFQQLSAVDGIIFYTVQIFQAAGAMIDPYASSIIVTMVELCSAGLVVLIVEKANRKIFLYVSSVGTCICLGVLGLYFNLKHENVEFAGMGFLPIVSMIGFNIFFAMGLGPIPWMINGELFAPEIKGVANGITIATNWVLLFVITKTLPMMLDGWGPHYTFYTYSTCMVACAVFVKFCVPETRGKTLEQIQDELKA